MKASDDEPVRMGFNKELFAKVLAFQLANGNKAVTLTRGEDYFGDDASIRSNIYKWALARGLRVSVNIKDRHAGLLVKFYKANGDQLDAPKGPIVNAHFEDTGSGRA